VLYRLADTGNMVIVIEHNLGVIKSAVWMVGLGPRAVPAGGTIVVSFAGRVAGVEGDYTSSFLMKLLG
jgi:excinuclease ABC subunit A